MRCTFSHAEVLRETERKREEGREHGMDTYALLRLALSNAV